MAATWERAQRLLGSSEELALSRFFASYGKASYRAPLNCTIAIQVQQYVKTSYRFRRKWLRRIRAILRLRPSVTTRSRNHTSCWRLSIRSIQNYFGFDRIRPRRVPTIQEREIDYDNPIRITLRKLTQIVNVRDFFENNVICDFIERREIQQCLTRTPTASWPKHIHPPRGNQ